MLRLRRALTVLLLAAVVSACDEEVPTSPTENGIQPQLYISDGARGGNAGFYFLPPLGARPTGVAPLEPNLEPTVELCEWTGSACAGPPMMTGTPVIRGLLDEHGDERYYRVDFDFRQTTLVRGTVYRIRVLAGGNELGYADISPRNPRGTLALANNGMTAGSEDIIAVGIKQTLPIKFLILEGTVALPDADFVMQGPVTAGVPVVFEATATTAPDGSPLTYSWDFGDGSRGGGRTISHIYTEADDFRATLVVSAADGTTASTSQPFLVQPGAPVTGSATVAVSVVATDGSPLSGASIRWPAGGSTGTTGADGMATVSGVGTGAPVLLKISRGGYADQFVPVTIPTGENQAFVTATLRPREAAIAVPSIEQGADVMGMGGVRVQLPADGLVDSNGRPVTGTVDVSLTPVDVTEPGAGGFPGGFSAVETDGTSAELLSYGVAEFVLSQNGQDLNLALGSTATVEIPISVSGVSIGQVIPLWSLDEATGLWIREGDGVVVVAPNSSTGLALRAQVSHFSWWNADVSFQPHFAAVTCTDAGLPVSCMVRASQLDSVGSPMYFRNEIVPAGGATIPIQPNVDVTIEAVGAFGSLVAQTVVNGGVGGTTNVPFNLTAVYEPTVICQDASSAPVACTIAGDVTSPWKIYEKVPAGGRSLRLPANTPVTLDAFGTMGDGATVTIQGPPGTTPTEIIPLIGAAFVADVMCTDRLGAPSSCSIRWWDGVWNTASIGVLGKRITLPPNDTISVQATGPWGIFQNNLDVFGPAGVVATPTIALVGQGGEFCGGAPLSIMTVRVVPNSGCPGGNVVSSPQEAILLVQHGGTIEFDNGTHVAKQLITPRDDLTLRSVPGATAVVLAGTGVAAGYDGPAFQLTGAGDLVVRDLTFRSPGIGLGGLGFITGMNSIFGQGAFTSVLADNLRFENLRLGLIALPGASASAAITVRNSTFVGGSAQLGAGTQLLVINHDSGAARVVATGNSFIEAAGVSAYGIRSIDFSRSGPPQGAHITATGNSFLGASVALSGSVGDGSLISNNTIQETAGGTRIQWSQGIELTAVANATVTIANNTVAGSFAGGDPNDPQQYSFDDGIQVTGDATTTFFVSRNTITGSANGLNHKGASLLLATDLVIDQVRLGIGSDEGTNANVQKSDISNYVVPFAHNVQPFGAGTLGCNWWGSPAGPFGGAPDPIYVPWAIAPIANGAGGACTGN